MQIMRIICIIFVTVIFVFFLAPHVAEEFEDTLEAWKYWLECLRDKLR